MKRFLIFIVFIIAFVLISGSEDIFVLSRLDLNGRYRCYAQDVKSVSSGFDVDINGNGKIVSCDMLYAGEIDNYILGKVYGESITFEGSHDDFINVIKKLNINIVAAESVENLESIYGFGRFGKCVMINGKSVNIQVAYSLGYITIGCPIILGSY